MQPIHFHFCSGCDSSEQLSRIHTILTNLNERQEALMSATQLINSKLDQLKLSIDQMKERVQTDIDYLKTRINSGEQVTTSDLEALEAKINSIIVTVNDVDPIPDIPSPEPISTTQPVADPIAT